MPIITKPSPLEKDATGVFTLDKTALALHPLVSGSAHFSSPNVWDKIIVKYKSETLGQFESIEFEASASTPEGQFFVSATAEDVFEVEKITIIDKDGAILLIPRADLTVAEFDIDFAAAGNFLANSVVWNVNVNGHTLGSNGSASKLASDGTLTMLNASSGFSGNFELQYTFNFSDTAFDYFAVGLSNNSGLDAAIHFYRTAASSNWKIWKSFDRITIPNADFNQSEPNTITFIRSGTDVQVLLNSVLKFTFTNESQTLYPGTRLAGTITSATYEIP